MFIIYAVLMTLIGFMAASIIFFMLFLVFFRSWNWKYYIIAIASSVLITVFFQFGLNVRLP